MCHPADEVAGEPSVGTLAFIVATVGMGSALPADMPGHNYGRAFVALIGGAIVGAMAGATCESVRSAMNAPTADEARHGLHKHARLTKREDERLGQGP